MNVIFAESDGLNAMYSLFQYEAYTELIMRSPLAEQRLIALASDL